MNPSDSLPPPLPPNGGARPARFILGPVSVVTGSLLTGLYVLIAFQDWRSDRRP